MTNSFTAIDQLAVNTIRTLAIDGVEKAKSGHPGMPMGAAPMAYVLWSRFMKHNPQNPNWINRDRFVLSAGHGSMLLYSLLHLHGYNLSLDDLKSFRQWGSLTPGHPEYGHTPGVDVTTGPLGQGIGMAVGMAMAEAHLAATYNRDGFPLIDHYTYGVCGDGDLMEGISSEAASLAGHLRLGKLVVLYDSNDISLDGNLSESFSENVLKRFDAYGWQVLRVEDGNDLNAIEDAIQTARSDASRPALIEIKTVIGYGSPNKAGSHKSHGEPLGAEEVAMAKKAYGWEAEEPFHVPAAVREHFAALVVQGQQAEDKWNDLFQQYQSTYSAEGKQFLQASKGELPQGWDEQLPSYEPGTKVATRQASGNALNAIAPRVPALIGGSADLAGSNKTNLVDYPVFHAENYAGRNIWFGVREHAMGAAMNGMSLHGGVRVYGGTFFVFSDYLRPSIRLAALMKQPVVYVFTHDSIAVGEDGPTHEPIEQLPSLRALPGITVLRPADANETSQAWKYAMENTEGPVALVLTRQNLPVLPGSRELSPEYLKRGAYVLSDVQNPQGILLATGSEVSLAVAAQKQLSEEGISVRVVSMPSWELFEKQSPDYRESVLPANLTVRVAMEMASPLGWERYVGTSGRVIGINTFGASAPGEILIEKYGFTVQNVVSHVKELLK